MGNRRTHLDKEEESLNKLEKNNSSWLNWDDSGDWRSWGNLFGPGKKQDRQKGNIEDQVSTLSDEQQSQLLESIRFVPDPADDAPIDEIPELENVILEKDLSVLIEEDAKQTPEIYFYDQVKSYFEQTELVVEAPTFSKAWKEAATRLTPGAGQSWIWRKRNPKNPVLYKDRVFGFAYSTAAAWYNHTHNTLEEINLEELKEISGDEADYTAVKAMKTDVLLSDAFTALVYNVQKIIFTGAADCTGKLDQKTKDQIVIYKKRKQAQADALKDPPAPKSTLPPETTAALGTAPGSVTDSIIGGLFPTKFISQTILEKLRALPPAYLDASAKAYHLDAAAEYLVWKESVPKDVLNFIFPGLGFAWPYMMQTMVGYHMYYYQLPQGDNARILLRPFELMASPDYYLGFIKGIFAGIKNWFVDLLEGIKAIGELVYEISKSVLLQPLEIAKQLGSEKTQADKSWFDSNKEEIFKVFTLLYGSDEARGALVGALHTQALKASFEWGGEMAKKIIDYLFNTPGKVGEDIGSVVGYLIPEIVLLVGTEGIGTVLKNFFSGAGKLSKLLKVFSYGEKLIGTTAKFVREIIEDITAFIKMLKGKGQKVLTELGDKLEDMIQSLKKIFGLTDEAADVAKTEEKVDNLAGAESKADDALEKRKDTEEYKDAEKEAKEEMDADEPDIVEKTKALAEAIIAINYSNNVDETLAELWLKLTLIDVRYKVVKDFEFESLPDGDTQIWMISSKKKAQKKKRSKRRPVDLPSINNVSFDWDEVFSGHTNAGIRNVQSELAGKGKTAFADMAKEEIERIVKNAYNNIYKKLNKNGGATKFVGEAGNWTVEFWVDLENKIVRTAYPTHYRGTPLSNTIKYK